MNLEYPQQEQQPKPSEVVEIPEPFDKKESAVLEENRVSHYFVKNAYSEGSTEFFTLQTEIDAMHYSFDLVPVYGMHELSFTTQEYGFASTNLSEEGRTKLEETLGKLVHSVLAKYPLKEIYVKPAPEATTVRDIEDCIEEILLKRDYESREGLLKKYKKEGWGQLFSDYRDIVGHEFQKADTVTDRTAARSRLFKMGLKRLFPDWKIDEITDQKWILRPVDRQEKGSNFVP